MTALGSSPSRGTGLLALFCDLEAQWREEFRQWLVEDMFPARLAIGFRACASYDLVAPEGASGPPAQTFLTLYETAAAGDLYARPYQRLRENRDARDRAFHARFRDLDRYVLTWLGPERAGAGSRSLAPVVHATRFDLREDALAAFNAWFVDAWLPACAALAGCLRVRRYLAIEGPHAHLVLAEFGARDFERDPAWQALQQDAAWSALAGPRLAATYARIVEATA